MTNKMTKKPASSTASKISAIANIYSSVKLNQVAVSSRELVNIQAQSLELEKDIARIQSENLKAQKENNYLQEQANEKLDVIAHQQKIKNKRDALRDKIDDFRYENEQAEKKKEKLAKDYLKSIKNHVHSIQRELQTIQTYGFTPIELNIIYENLRQEISGFTAADFDEIPDKNFFDATRDILETHYNENNNSLKKSDFSDVVVLKSKKMDNILKKLEKETKIINKFDLIDSKIADLRIRLTKFESLNDYEYEKCLEEIKLISEDI